MRFSEWTAAAPVRSAVSQQVLDTLLPVLRGLTGRADPVCWVVWGDEPATRYVVISATAPGLVTVHVRVNVPGEGPRAAGKITRWGRVQVGDISFEATGGHRLTTQNLEGLIIRGLDAEADTAVAFLRSVLAAADGRTLEEPEPGPIQAGSSSSRRRRPSATAG